MTIPDRKRGCMYGLAIGDALGAQVEFQRPGSFERVAGFRGGGPHGLKPGEWTDETSMALALADSIVLSGWDCEDQMRRYLDWWRNGSYSTRGHCFDISSTLSSTLYEFEVHGDIQQAHLASERSTNNGSVSRLAPVVVHFHHDPIDVPLLSERALDSSRTTHSHHECVSACRYCAVLMAGLISGEDRDTVLSADWEPVQELRETAPLHRNVELVIGGSYRVLRPPEIQASGYAAKCLEAALWAFHDAQSFSEAVLKSVNLGYDADNVGAICGQIAGAAFGCSGIPGDWMEQLKGRPLIEKSFPTLLTAAPS